MLLTNATEWVLILMSRKNRDLLLEIKALNDDLPSTLTVHQVAETRLSHDRPVDANMASREHYFLQYGVRIVDWTIYF